MSYASQQRYANEWSRRVDEKIKAAGLEQVQDSVTIRNNDDLVTWGKILQEVGEEMKNWDPGPFFCGTLECFEQHCGRCMQVLSRCICEETKRC